MTTVKPKNNDHPRDPKFVALLMGGRFSEVALSNKMHTKSYIGTPKLW